MHHYILNHRELYGLPRKFNIAFDGGGRIAGAGGHQRHRLQAVESVEGRLRRRAGRLLPAHARRHHRPQGLRPRHRRARSGPTNASRSPTPIVRVFIEHGDRTDRKKARLKYVLDAWGFDEVPRARSRSSSASRSGASSGRAAASRAGRSTAWPMSACTRRSRPGLNYVGVVLPVGRLHGRADARPGGDRRAISATATIRLTVWQNLLISDVADERRRARQAPRSRRSASTGDASSVRAGLVACTGNAGCKFAASDTKRHAVAIGRLPRRARRPRHADQHPPDRLPSLLRPALHRRHRPARRPRCRGRRGRWSRAITSSSAAASGPMPISAGSSRDAEGRGSAADRRAAADGYLANRALAGRDVPDLLRVAMTVKPCADWSKRKSAA